MKAMIVSTNSYFAIGMTSLLYCLHPNATAEVKTSYNSDIFNNKNSLILWDYDTINFKINKTKPSQEPLYLMVFSDLIKSDSIQLDTKSFAISMRISITMLQSFLKNTKIPRVRIRLTKTEREILYVISNGFSNKKTSIITGLSVKNISLHKQNALKKIYNENANSYLMLKRAIFLHEMNLI